MARYRFTIAQSNPKDPVQGVGLRYFLSTAFLRHGIPANAQNDSDGVRVHVTLEAASPEAAKAAQKAILEDLAAYAQKPGSSLPRRVDATSAAPA